ncbi:NADH dehydrogenase [[Actinomadura] parvosata subsp. kistnae]|uniref:hypothetical protein n=1 Tax=[Actinomadura] parvosata TaxID=1955412 RepID=UPI000D29821B|nr:NADH dehydrogenase [Actinomadura parvosata subsp. kistnae]
MPEIVVVGGGFAGVWSAAAAARDRGDSDLRITLIAPSGDMVLRPRLHRLDPDWARVPLAPLPRPDRRHPPARPADHHRHRPAPGALRRALDRLRPADPAPAPGANLLFDIDTVEGVTRLARHLNTLRDFTAVIAGAGFTGLELATTLAERG